MDAWAERLRTERTQQGMSLRQLGTQLGVSFSTLGRIERGEGEPDRHTRMLLERWLDPSTEVACACPRCVPSLAARMAQLEARMETLEQLIHGLLILLLLLVPVPAWSATYYVATSGNDSNPCTEAQPCASYARARTNLASGDTLYFRGGTYTENLMITKDSVLPSGTGWGSATTIAGYPGETVTLAGGQGIQVTIYDRALMQYVVFKNFHLTNNSTLNAQGCGYRPDGSVDMGCGPHFLRFQDIEISGTSCNSAVGNGYGASDLQYLNINVHDGGCDRLDHGFYVLSPRGLYDGITVNNYSGYCFQLYDSGCPSADGGVSRDCGDDTVIRNSHFSNCRGDGAVTLNHGDNIQFYGNTVTNSHNGVEVSYGTPDGTTVHDNTIADNTGAAIHVGESAVNTHVYNNQMTNNGAGVDNRGTGTTSEPGVPPSDPPSGGGPPKPTPQEVAAGVVAATGPAADAARAQVIAQTPGVGPPTAPTLALQSAGL